MRSCVSLAIAGAGGSGVVSAGQFLLKTAGQLGYYGLAQRSFGPQIRGGESVSLLRLGTAPISCQDDSYHVVALLDVDKVLRFKDEMPLSKDSLVILPDTDIEPPAFVRQVGCRVLALPLNSLAKEIDEGQANMVITGVLAQALELPLERLEQVVADQLAHKGEAVVGAALSCIEAGIALAEAHGIQLQLAPAPREADRHWISNGNDLAGFGALNTGIRFVAAYPITPASGALEWLAPNLEKVGGDLVQAEDELASINMIIGSSFGGVPSMTATSGPGLALMTESLGLAVASETPVTILNVMRGGPSTGIPTKSEQSDLNIALHGLHGDAPHIVIAALSIADCAFSSGWGVWLAEATQSVAIVLSDQAMA
ncbi:MAG: 2-oxoacid:acceptor oxidoreductase family protein, partial [Cellvibrionaceae bacterium]|nr:2-oxoacid:acceptor oxidoreductase family protein [Cellvibrionaceae bacterium]